VTAASAPVGRRVDERPAMPRPLAYGALALAALLFGATFVVVKDALASFPPFAFVGWRFLLGGLALLLLARPRGSEVWRDGLVAGSLLFLGYGTQTLGLTTTTAANSGLITGLYVVFTPLLAAALRRRRPAPTVVAGAGAALGGLWLLSGQNGLRLHPGDLLTVACALAFAAHILVLARFSPRHRVVPFTAVQLLVVATLSLFAALGEGFPLPGRGVAAALLLTGLAASAAAFVVQVGAQRVVGPSRTAIVLALEPVFATATATLVLGERLAGRGWLGAAAIVAGIYLVVAISPAEEADVRAATAFSAPGPTEAGSIPDAPAAAGSPGDIRRWRRAGRRARG